MSITSDQLQSWKVQQNNRYAPPTLHHTASDQLGPVCEFADICLQNQGTPINGYDYIQPGTVSSATCTSPCKLSQHDTTWHYGTPTYAKPMHSICGPVGRLVRVNERRNQNCPSLLHLQIWQNCSTHISILPWKTWFGWKAAGVKHWIRSQGDWSLTKLLSKSIEPFKVLSQTSDTVIEYENNILNSICIEMLKCAPFNAESNDRTGGDSHMQTQMPEVLKTDRTK